MRAHPTSNLTRWWAMGTEVTDERVRRGEADDEGHWEWVRANQRLRDTYRAQRAMRCAASYGVQVQQLPWERYPGMWLRLIPHAPHTQAAPPRHGHPPRDVHITLVFGRWWSVQEVEIPDMFYGRWWHYPLSAVARMWPEIARWNADPDSEPRMYMRDHRGHDDR